MVYNFFFFGIENLLDLQLILLIFSIKTKHWAKLEEDIA